ncbi:MAG: hypothetical protein JWP22_765, partial [Ramlibacter sp.]|nr:hypothetical protein [Ramlibacter sp.]
AAPGTSASAGAQPVPPAPPPASVQEAAARFVTVQAADYEGPAVTPAQAMNIDREQDRFARKGGKDTKTDEGSDASAMVGGPAQCVP